jgi:ribosomal protein L37AE/L43A
MLPFMISTAQAVEHYCCPNCQMWFRVLRERVRDYQSGSFNCIKCKAEVISWVGVFGYSNWTPVGTPTAIRKPAPDMF